MGLYYYLMQVIKNLLKIKNTRSISQTIYIVGNKINLPERKVHPNDVKELEEKSNLQYYEMNFKLNMNT